MYIHFTRIFKGALYIRLSGPGNSGVKFSPSAYAEVAAALEGCSTRSCLESALPRCVEIDGLTWGALVCTPGHCPTRTCNEYSG